MPVVSPLPEFTALSEAEVLRALDDPAAANPVANEVARLIAGYTENFKAHVERLGYFPADILRVKPSSPIEAVAMRLITEAIQAEIAGHSGIVERD